MVDDDDWTEVRQVLDAEIGGLDHEAESLYDEVERYAEVASVMESAGRSEDAEYFKELAVERYDCFVDVVQLKKDAEDYEF